MGVTSEQDCRNMNRFVVSCAFLAVAMGAPSHVAVGSLGYAGQVVSAPVAHAPAVVGQTHHSYAAGPAVVENKPVYGVVGQRTVQTGEVSVVAGHQYAVAGVEHIPQPATSYVAGAPQNLDVPVAVPRAVPREIIVEQKVAKPYEVPVPRAVPVPAPYKVHPVQEIVETPYIHHQTVETHSTQAVVTAHATPVHAVAHAPVAVAHAAPAVAAAPVAAGYSYGVGYAAAAAPVAAVAGHYAASPAATAVIA